MDQIAALNSVTIMVLKQSRLRRGEENFFFSCREGNKGGDKPIEKKLCRTSIIHSLNNQSSIMGKIRNTSSVYYFFSPYFSLTREDLS